MAKQMTFVTAMRDYFGNRPGIKPEDSAKAFMQELKALTSEDRAWFRENLPKVGYEIVAV